MNGATTAFSGTLSFIDPVDSIAFMATNGYLLVREIFYIKAGNAVKVLSATEFPGHRLICSLRRAFFLPLGRRLASIRGHFPVPSHCASVPPAGWP